MSSPSFPQPAVPRPSREETPATLPLSCPEWHVQAALGLGDAVRRAAKEYAIARAGQPGVLTMLPIIAEVGLRSPLLDDSVAADISNTTVFEHVMDQIALMVRGAPVAGFRDEECLRSDLDRIARQCRVCRP